MKKLISTLSAAIALGLAGCGGNGSIINSNTILAADGKTGHAGYLYAIDRTTGEVTPLFALPVPVRGMAFAPDGTLYAITHSCYYDGSIGKLVTIDPNDGTVTEIGDLHDEDDEINGGDPDGCMGDIEFIGDELYGMTLYENGQMVKIDTATGMQSLVGDQPWPNNNDVRGSGLVYDGTELWLLRPDNLPILPLDPESGDIGDDGPTPDVSDYAIGNGRLGNGTRASDGTVYARRNQYDGEGQLLITLDLETGDTEVVTLLPGGVSSIVAVP